MLNLLSFPRCEACGAQTLLFSLVMAQYFPPSIDKSKQRRPPLLESQPPNSPRLSSHPSRRKNSGPLERLDNVVPKNAIAFQGGTVLCRSVPASHWHMIGTWTPCSFSRRST